MTVTEPIDRTHADSVWAITKIRERVAQLRLAILVWEPRPYPMEGSET